MSENAASLFGAVVAARPVALEAFCAVDVCVNTLLVLVQVCLTFVGFAAAWPLAHVRSKNTEIEY